MVHSPSVYKYKNLLSWFSQSKPWQSCNWDAILLHLADKNFIGNTFLTRQFCEGLMLIDPSVNCFSISGSMGLSGVTSEIHFCFQLHNSKLHWTSVKSDKNNRMTKGFSEQQVFRFVIHLYLCSKNIFNVFRLIGVPCWMVHTTWF